MRVPVATPFIRFLLVGGAAAAVNVAARAGFNLFTSYEVAIIFAFPVALTFAFVLNRRYVFQNTTGARLGQYLRFTLVNLVALAPVWIVSVALARWIFPAVMFTWHADTVAHIIGVLSPVVASYFGHRVFTFRMIMRSATPDGHPVKQAPRASITLSAIARAGATAIAVSTALYVIIGTLAAVYAYHHDLPYWDAWAATHDYQRLLSGDYNVFDFFSQHNEHRIATARVLFFLDYYAFHGLGWLPLVAMVLIQLVHAAFFCRLATGACHPSVWALGASLIVSLMLSASQMENFAEAFQISFVLAVAATTLTIVLFAQTIAAARSARPYWHRCALTVAALAIATYSLAGGVLAGIVVVAVAILWRAPWKPVLAFAAATVVLAGLYIHGYVAPGGHPSTSIALHHPVRFVLYIAAYLGTPVPTWGLWPAAILGSIGLGLTAAATLRQLRSGRSADVLSVITHSVILVAVAWAAVTAIGRLGFGVPQALAGRYATPAVAFWAAQIVFWAPVVSRMDRTRLANGLVSAATVAVCVVLILVQAAEIGNRSQVLLGTDWAADAMKTGLDDDEAFLGAFPVPAFVKPLVSFMRDNKLSIFSTADARLLDGSVSNGFVLEAPATCVGSFETTGPRKSDQIVSVGGWAWNRRLHSRPRHLIITNDQGRIVGYASTGLPRPDALQAVKALPGKTRKWIRLLHPYDVNIGWRGFARASAGDRLHAYAEQGALAVCEIGVNRVP